MTVKIALLLNYLFECFSSILGELCSSLCVSFNHRLALFPFWWFLSCVQYHSLDGRSFQRLPFLSPYLLSHFSCLLVYFLIAIATKDMLLLQLTTFRANVYIFLNFNNLVRFFLLHRLTPRVHLFLGAGIQKILSKKLELSLFLLVSYASSKRMDGLWTAYAGAPPLRTGKAVPVLLQLQLQQLQAYI